jgi:hypothetical protein
MQGEALHEAGRDGALRAKRWLERTTRVDVTWVNPDALAKLTFPWQSGGTFSFDLGGRLRGGDLNGQEFFAEVKRYYTVGDQAGLYDEYLAKCYTAYSSLPSRCDHFFWLTWHPFSQSKWNDLCKEVEVRKAVLNHREKCLGETDLPAAQAMVDASICTAVAERLWVIVLSDKQETLVVEDAHLDAVFALQRKKIP